MKKKDNSKARDKLTARILDLMYDYSQREKDPMKAYQDCMHAVSTSTCLYINRSIKDKFSDGAIEDYCTYIRDAFKTIKEELKECKREI